MKNQKVVKAILNVAAKVGAKVKIRYDDGDTDYIEGRVKWFTEDAKFWMAEIEQTLPPLIEGKKRASNYTLAKDGVWHTGSPGPLISKQVKSIEVIVTEG